MSRQSVERKGWPRRNPWRAGGALARFSVLVAVVAGIAFGLGRAPTPASASATFLVDSSGDASDSIPGDGVCATAGAVCTLRAAIEESNALAGADTINFGIGSGTVTITPLSALPAITDKVTINATTQPGWTFGPIVEIRGDSAGAGVDGLTVSAGSTTLRGLVINRFSGYGIHLTTLGSNVIRRCHIGTDFSATVDFGNGKSGVFIDNVANNIIGGTAPADGDSNLISGNNENGVLIAGASATGNTVVDNAIGTTGSTSAALANTLDGVRVDSSASANTITTNVISGNGLRGIYLTGGSSGTTVSLTGLGVNRFVNVDVGNGAEGVLIDGSNGNFIGLAGAGNAISGNGSSGVATVNGASSNTIRGNGIGTNGSGTAAIPNDLNGVTLLDGTGNTVGGVNAGEGNLISGNGGFAGIEFQDPNATGDNVQGNLIGTNAAGTGAVPNANDGVMLRSGSHGNTIGLNNVISGNVGWGVDMFDAASTSNVVLGNKIGTNASGTSALPNLGGVRVRSDGNQIGDTNPVDGNVISGNTTENLRIGDATHAVTSIQVFNNRIGTDVFGATGLGGKGVIIERSQANLGSSDGYTPGNNVIAGNSDSGIRILGSGADGNVIKGNRIGVSAFGAALGNNGYGVLISNGVNDNLGSPAYPNGNNLIAFNSLDGVRVDGAGVQGESIVGNSIYANGGLGIETVNSGNGELLPPVITAVGADISGTACALCIVNVYSDAAGQGRVYEGMTSASAGGLWTLSGVSVAGPHLTATATDASGTLGTSEFSAPFAVNINREAGTPGTPGFSGDGFAATSAQLNGPHGLYFTPSTLYIADTGNNRIRTVSPNNPSGIINTVAGCCASPGFGGDGGPAISAQLSSPTDVFVDGSGNIFIADTNNCRIRKVTGGTITTVAGNGTCSFGGDGGPATTAMINHPHGVAVTAGGDILIADTDNNRIRKVSGGTITTIAGTGNAAYYGEGIPATSAMLNSPHDVYPSPSGGYVIADTQNHRVRRVDGSGIIGTIAGTGTAGFSGDDGPGTLAQLNGPEAIAVSPIGDVFIADTGNNRIRDVLFGNGIIETVVGSGQTGSSPDAVNPLLATLNGPTGIADDELAVSDTGNHTVRSIAANVDPTTNEAAPTSRASTFCREGFSKPVGALADWSVIVGVVGMIATRRRWRALFALLSRRSPRATAAA